MKLTLESRRLITRLLRREFDQKEPLDLIYMGDGVRLIKLTQELGLDDLAAEMTDDLNSELAYRGGRLKNCA